MRAEHAAVEVDDLARRDGLGPQPLDQPGIVAVGDEADVLAVGLGGDHQPRFRGQRAHFALGQVAEREAQEVELLARSCRRGNSSGRAPGRAPLCSSTRPSLIDAADIMAGGEAIGAELAREARSGR